MNFLNLPEDVIGIILSEDNLTALDRAVAASVCRKFASLIWKEHPPLPKYLICNAAITAGYINIYSWGRANGCRCGRGAYVAAACAGQTDALRWLREHGYTFNRGICADAALHGHLETLQWLHSVGYPLTSWTMAMASRGGHLHVLRWLHEKKCRWSALSIWVMPMDAPIVEWIMQNYRCYKRCASGVISDAVRLGRPDILDLHVKNGLFSPDCLTPLWFGWYSIHKNILKWVQHNNILSDDDVNNIATLAITIGIDEILEWITTDGLPIKDDQVRWRICAWQLGRINSA